MKSLDCDLFIAVFELLGLFAEEIADGFSVVVEIMSEGEHRLNEFLIVSLIETKLDFIDTVFLFEEIAKTVIETLFEKNGAAESCIGVHG